jgi:uncharacterized protein (UPF0276 family)
MPNQSFPYLGFGLGLRAQHYAAILETLPPLDWLEILTENYLVPGGMALYYLDRIAEKYPLVMHGVSLSIGSSDLVNLAYLQQVKELIDRVNPVWISDHLCWTGVNGINTHDLLPLPYTEAVLDHVVSHINQVQDYLDRRILIENVSSYLTYAESEMSEWEFLTEITRRADCYILLDINNVYVSAFNHGFDPQHYLQGLPAHRVKQMHLAGHSHRGNYILDSHDAPVSKEVWDLYADALKYFGAVSTMIERDANIPELIVLLQELEIAKKIAQKHHARAAVIA